MDTENIAPFLERLKLGDKLALFKEQDISLSLLMQMNENDLQDMLKDLKLTIGTRWTIIEEIKRKKTGMYLDTYVKMFTLDCINTGQYVPRHSLRHIMTNVGKEDLALTR